MKKTGEQSLLLGAVKQRQESIRIYEQNSQKQKNNLSSKPIKTWTKNVFYFYNN